MTNWLLALGLWEAAWWWRRRHQRGVVYSRALSRARELGLPLLVIGAPDAGPTAGYGCGDVTVDLAETSCPRHIRADITSHIPLPDNSCVAFVSCVLEYVDNYDAALEEIWRVSSGEIFNVRVEPWTLTAHLYPGAKRTVPEKLTRPRRHLHPISMFIPGAP